MPKLPAAKYNELKKNFASGRIPEDYNETADALYGLVGDLLESLHDDARKPEANAVRSQVAHVLNITEAIPWDGMFTGVVLNQADLLPAMIAAAKAMGAATSVEPFERVLRLIPHGLLAATIDERLEWAQSSEAEAATAEIEQIEEEVEENEIRMRLYEVCFKRVLAEPEQFFVT